MTQATVHSPFSASSNSIDDLTRIFNTALIASYSGALRDFSAEIYALVESPAFRAILMSIKTLAQEQNISEREAAETVISTFRKADKLWGEYVFQEGVDRLKRSH
jgi:hypothetical protein